MGVPHWNYLLWIRKQLLGVTELISTIDSLTIFQEILTAMPQ
tara:strand:- start:251 stop:376 length:126 start_codon:yes stop_codon:yes gene_type:complete